MKLEMIDTPDCKDVETGELVKCENCLQTYIDNDVQKRSCNMIPKAVQKIKCTCGIYIKMPTSWKYIHCRNCKTYWKKDNNGKWHSKSVAQRRKEKITRMKQSQKQVLECDCGNKIPISDRTKERKCYNCDHYHIKGKDGKWIKTQGKETKDTMTFMNQAPDELKQLLGVK